MRPPKHTESDARSPDILPIHVCILHSIHQFDAMSSNVVVEACISCLVDISRVHTDRSLVSTLGQQAIFFVCKRQLIPRRQLKLLSEKVPWLNIDSDRVSIGTSSSQQRLGDERNGPTGEDQRSGETVFVSIEIGGVLIGIAVQVADIEKRFVEIEQMVNIPCTRGQQGIA